MTQKKPKKCWGSVRRVDTSAIDTDYYREWEYRYPDTTDEERHLLEHASKPVQKSAIVDMIARYLSVHKRMQVDGEKRQILFADYANMLYGLPEYALMLGINEMVENDASVWFPPCAVLKMACDKFLINQPEQMKGEKKL